MCGIVGIFSKIPLDNPNRLLVMRDSMTHRGPDSAGVWWSKDRRLGLAHCRLAVLELTTRGNQPMFDYFGQNVLTYNGEIYNHNELREKLEGLGHVFASKSDTEVLLVSYQQWGRDCLDQFEGAFSFALYDGSRKELFLARDRAGEKPLYYKITDKGFLFASELKALMADPNFPRILDLDSLNYFLTYGYVSGPKTILQGTCKLLPGHALSFSLEKKEVTVWQYWDLPQYAPVQDTSTEELTHELETLLSTAVCKQLEADVPVGILLSGGLDSSLITAIAAKQSVKPIKTFTVSFPGHGTLNEGPYAQLVADYFATEHTELVGEPVSMVSLLPKLAHQYDEPIGDHSILPTSMLAKLVGSSVTVALGGDGGDELFGGYPHHVFLQKIARIKQFLPGGIRSLCATTAARALPVGTKGRNHLMGLSGSIDKSFAFVNLFFDPYIRRKLLKPLYRNGFVPTVIPEDFKLSFHESNLTILQNATRIDFRTTLVDDYLVKTDRASMLSSLELRAPFLDRKLVEFAFGKVPDSLRASSMGRKILLRNLAKNLLPPALDINRKGGFILPLADWFKDEWGDFITEVLMEADSTIFDKKEIMKLLDLQSKGFANANRLFALTMFELWRKVYNVKI